MASHAATPLRKLPNQSVCFLEAHMTIDPNKRIAAFL